MVRLMDLIDVHNSIDVMKFSSFVNDYMYDDAFHDMVEAAGITPLDFLEQKVGEALDPIRSLDMDDYSKDYSHIVAAKDNLSMLLIDYYQAPALDDDNPDGVANIIYNSAWAGMHGEPIQVMKGLGYSRLMSSADVQRYDINDEVAESIVNRFCKNKEAAQVFKNINDGTQDPFGGPQENQVRKELNVPVDAKNDDLEKSV